MYKFSVDANTGEPEIDAVSAILIDAHRGQILFEKDPKEKLHISSANKIMTLSYYRKRAKTRRI